MVDALKRRAPNADMSFLDAKVRCQLNHTLEWLSQQPADEQQRLITFCVKQGRNVRKMRKERKRFLQEVMFGRQREKGRVVSVKERTKMNETIKMILRNGGSIDDVVRITACDIPDEQLNKMKTLMEALNVKQPVYMLLEHEKWSKKDKDMITWKGRVLRMRTKKEDPMPMIKVAYWLPGVGEESAVDSTFQFCNVICDIILKKCTLV